MKPQKKTLKKREYVAHDVKCGLGALFIVFLIELLRRPAIILMFINKIFGM